MNHFFKGFMSIFDWMCPRSLDEKLQDLYNDIRAEAGQRAHDITETTRRSAYAYFSKQFASLPVPTSWANAGFTRPSVNCTNRAADIASERLVLFGEMPVRHVLSKQGGIVLEYETSPRGTVNELCIEVDEDLEAIAVLSSGQKVIGSACYDIESERDSLHAR